jgi:cell division protein FtsL
VSSPASILPDPVSDPRPTTEPSVRPTRTAAARPPHPSPPLRERARRGSPFAFWILVAFVGAAMVLGIASLSALLVQASFQIDDLRSSVASLEQQHEVLREQVAADSSPQRVMQWARERGMQMPERVVIVHLPATEGPG